MSTENISLPSNLDEGTIAALGNQARSTTAADFTGATKHHCRLRIGVHDMTNPVFQDPSVCPEKHDREAFGPDAGQRSRAIIPGDDPGDQQLPERRLPFAPRAVAANTILQKNVR